MTSKGEGTNNSGKGKVATSVPFTGDNILIVITIMGAVIVLNVIVSIIVYKKRYKRMK